jgi:hypothetical protein
MTRGEFLGIVTPVLLLAGCVSAPAERRAIATNRAPAAIASYSQAIQVGRMLYLSGQVGLDHATGQLVAGGIQAEARRALEPPGDALHLCGGHVTGAPFPDGKPGPHIIWEAYSSQELPTALAKRYLDSLGSETHSRSDGCDLWRFPPDKPTHTLEVCPVSFQGPWSECSHAPSRAAKSIILISSMAQPTESKGNG